jgi:DNA invertase Pin-like site-specific DNA recombinase
MSNATVEHSGRFIGYYRVSRDKQARSGLGLDAQRQTVTDFLNGGDWSLIASFTEVESGRRSDRPELARALAACRARRATLVIAKLDRLTRDTKFLLTLLDSGADVLFCDLPQIPVGPMGRFMLTQMVSVAELEAGLVSSRTKAALAQAKARGTVLGGFKGYVLTEADHASGIAVRQQKARNRARDLAPVLAEIQAAGITSANGIARELTARDIPTARGATTWTAVQVQRLLADLE